MPARAEIGPRAIPTMETALQLPHCSRFGVRCDDHDVSLIQVVDIKRASCFERPMMQSEPHIRQRKRGINIRGSIAGDLCPSLPCLWLATWCGGVRPANRPKHVMCPAPSLLSGSAFGEKAVSLPCGAQMTQPIHSGAATLSFQDGGKPGNPASDRTCAVADFHQIASFI